jgi:hypothetical protein
MRPPKSPSIEVQGEVEFPSLPIRVLYNNNNFKQHTLHVAMLSCTSSSMSSSHNTDFKQPVVQRCRSIFTLYVFPITLGVLLYPTAL